MRHLYDIWSAGEKRGVEVGDLQLGVPQREVVKESSPMIFARPKSASFTVRSLSSKRIFSGLISLWTIFRSCCRYRY